LHKTLEHFTFSQLADLADLDVYLVLLFFRLSNKTVPTQKADLFYFSLPVPYPNQSPRSKKPPNRLLQQVMDSFAQVHHDQHDHNKTLHLIRDIPKPG